MLPPALSFTRWSYLITVAARSRSESGHSLNRLVQCCSQQIDSAADLIMGLPSVGTKPRLCF